MRLHHSTFCSVVTASACFHSPTASVSTPCVCGSLRSSALTLVLYNANKSKIRIWRVYVAQSRSYDPWVGSGLVPDDELARHGSKEGAHGVEYRNERVSDYNRTHRICQMEHL